MSDTINPIIYISAGEASGDLLGADLARTLHQKNPEWQLIGMGGVRMQAAGIKIHVDSRLLSVVGVFEIIRSLPRIIYTLHKIKKIIKKIKPDLLILIDFPDTHFRIMKYAKKLGIPVLYYVSPQIWAWRFNRIKQIKKYVTHMAVLFSFEEKIYRDAQMPVTFVGHPLAELVKSAMTKEAAYPFFNLNSQYPVIVLFPGSRHSEMMYHLPVMIESAKKITKKIPHAQFVLVLANHFDEKIIRNHLYDLLQITDATIAVSGTVTLEIALMQVPLCIIYKMHPLTFWLAKKLIHLKQIGLCNIVLEKQAVKEFIQDDANANNIAEEIIKIISDIDYRKKIKSDFSDIKNKISISHENASGKAADVVMAILHDLP